MEREIQKWKDEQNMLLKLLDDSEKKNKEILQNIKLSKILSLNDST